MIKINKFFKLNVLAVLLIGFLTVGVYGAEFNPVADEMIGSSGISWAPKVSYSQLVVIISRPDGTQFRKTFNSGSSPYVDLSNIFGESYLDGSYTYELVVVPFEKRVRGSEEKRSAGSEWHDKGLTQSGSFFVQGGAIVSNTIYEPGSEETAGSFSGAQDGLSGVKDIVHVDDVIIQFSLCVGNDCVNGENFGFDTLRLKENNLRIHFNDTSNSASFPSNDWRIVANDSTNGGANYLAIEDSDAGRQVFKVLAGAPANSVYVNSSGHVGFGTSSPVVDLHAVSGNTPTLRLEQNGSSGFTPQTWDVAGNEANFFVRDATNGSRLPFKIKPGAPDNSLFVKSDGKIGFGTQSPGFPLHLVTDSSTNAALVLERTGGVQNFINATAGYGNFGTVNNFPAQIMTNSAWRMRINTDGTLDMSDGGSYDGNWNSASSRELKENIKSISADEAIDALDGLNPVKYNYKNDRSEEHVGFIAEDVPELVSMKDRKNLSTMDIVAVLTKVLQEQQKVNREQQKNISELKKRIAELEKK